MVKGSPGEYFDILEKSVQCENLLQNDIFDSVADGKPLSFDQLPKSIQDEFTYRVSIVKSFNEDTLIDPYFYTLEYSECGKNICIFPLPLKKF